MTVNTTATAPAVRGRPCPLCETPAGQPCQPQPAGDHLARYLDAYTAGQLTKAYMAMVLGELVVIDACAVIAGSDGTEALPMPAALFGPVLGRLLQEGCRLAYGPAPAGGLCAGLSDAEGRHIQCGYGASAGEALADLQRRLDGAR